MVIEIISPTMEMARDSSKNIPKLVSIMSFESMAPEPMYASVPPMASNIKSEEKTTPQMALDFLVGGKVKHTKKGRAKAKMDCVPGPKGKSRNNKSIRKNAVRTVGMSSIHRKRA